MDPTFARNPKGLHVMTVRTEMETFAAEYALGLLEGESHTQAEKLVAEDREFAAAVTTWREHLSEFDLTAPLAAAGAELWTRISASVAEMEVRHIPLQASSAPARRPKASLFTHLWDSLAVWRTVGLTGGAAALSLALALVLTPHSSPNPVYVAVLMTDAALPAAIVNTYSDGHVELVPLEPISVPEGKALQVWTLWDRERGPVSVGLLERAHSVSLDTAQLPRTGANQLFEISLEPKLGSSAGRPTGPVLMKGTTHAAL